VSALDRIRQAMRKVDEAQPDGVILCGPTGYRVTPEELEILWVFDAWLRRQAGPGNALDRYGDGGTIT
jgi:hypothetical protein